MDRAQLNSADAVHPIRETPERLARIVGGELIQAGGSALSCSGLALDSRKVQPGELFVALRGPRFDAHEFLGDAIARGAAGLIVERAPKLELPSGVFAIVVPHARQALIDMARARRAQLDIPVFAITGTCGKTSTKEMLRHLLEGCCHVYASPKSFNNEIGLPWTLLQAPEDCGALVLEIGTNGPGEIAALSDLARPTLGCVTMAGRGHLERLGTIDGVAHEKSALLAALPEDGVAILNADDERLPIFAAAAGVRRQLRFGIGEKAQVRASEIRMHPGGVSFELWVAGGATGNDAGSGGPRRVELPLLGMPALRNFLAAFALAHASGLAPGIGALLSRAATLPGVARRLERKDGPRGAQLLDDSYNANPESLLAAASVVDRWPGARRRILVLGEMLELGEHGAQMHEELGAAMAGRFDVLIGIGETAGRAAEGFARACREVLSISDPSASGVSLGAQHHPFEALVMPSREAAARWLFEQLGEGDVVLLKGSRLAAIDELVDELCSGAREDPPQATSARRAPGTA